jgi:FtsZ-interacting cell division protein ZipA
MAATDPAARRSRVHRTVEYKARSAPALGSVAEPEVRHGADARLPQSPSERGTEPAVRERESRRAPPIINWSVELLPAGADRAAAGDEPAAPGADTVAPPQDQSPGAPPLIVAWPAEDQRSIVTLRVLPAGVDRLAGRALRLALTACGFRHGQFGIFHLPGEDGHVVLSAASLVRPGTLDPAAMDQQRYSGVNLFAVLPGSMSADLTLQQLGQVALELAERVGGLVQDERSAPFIAAEAGSWRRRRLGALGAAEAGSTGPAD